MIATYTYDYADRQTTLSFRDGEEPPQPLVTSASYKPFGPVMSITLDNGLTETRTYTTRYFPWTIEVPDRLRWTYETDAVGNIAAIMDNVDPATSQTYSYQDYQYYLTGGVGPLGDLSWSYDKTGNRLSETSAGTTSTYTYRRNASGSNSPQLAQISVDGEQRPSRYYYDVAGNLTNVAATKSLTRFNYNAANRLSEIRTESATTPPTLTTFRYDGRSYLSRSLLQPDLAHPQREWVTRPTYSSEGILHHRYRNRYPTPRFPSGSSSTTGDDYVFYFTHRPVAQLTKLVVFPPGKPGSPITALRFISVDHLGTPIMAITRAGALSWRGQSEPFGTDRSGALEAGMFLRFPGQWDDETWQGSGSGISRHYNLHRWYLCRLGQYSRTDPEFLADPSRQLPYRYAYNRPTGAVDPFGLRVTLIDATFLEHLICIKKHAESPIRDAWDYLFYQTPTPWEIRGMYARASDLMSRETLRRFQQQGNEGRASSTDRPGLNWGFYQRPGRIWIDPRRNLDCVSIVKSIIHEMYEAFLVVNKRLNSWGAHAKAREIDRNHANEICRCCSEFGDSN